MNKPIQIVHSDVPITYDEAENVWRFTLRDRDRNAPSLALAKEFIDKPVPANERKPFKRIPVWYCGWNELPKKAEVTGIAEQRSYGSYVWITCEGRRSKESTEKVFPQNAKNDRLFEHILAKHAERDALNDTIYKLEEKRDRLVLSKED